MKRSPLAWLLLGLALLMGGAQAWAAEAAPGDPPPSLAIQAPTPELAAHIRQVVDQTHPRLRQLIGAAPERMAIRVPAERADFDRLAEERGGPTWAAGLAFPAENLILIRSPKQLTQPDDFAYVLIHELTHLYLAAELGQRRPPLWLEEGIAMYAAGQGGIHLTAAMSSAVLVRGLLPLGSISARFPARDEDAALAYAQSYYLVSWLLTEYGQDAVARIIAELGQGRELTAALDRVTGSGAATLERLFKEEMTSRFSWIAVLTAGGVLWGLIAIIAGLGLVIRRRSQLRRRKAMGEAEDEEPDAPSPHRREGLPLDRSSTRGGPAFRPRLRRRQRPDD